jgi:hypothetical protein
VSRTTSTNSQPIQDRFLPPIAACTIQIVGVICSDLDVAAGKYGGALAHLLFGSRKHESGQNSTLRLAAFKQMFYTFV